MSDEFYTEEVYSDTGDGRYHSRKWHVTEQAPNNGTLYDFNNPLCFQWLGDKLFIHTDNKKYCALFTNCSQCFACGPTAFKCPCGGQYDQHRIVQYNGILVEKEWVPHPIKLAKVMNAPSRLPTTVYELKSIMDMQPFLYKDANRDFKSTRVHEHALRWPLANDKDPMLKEYTHDTKGMGDQNNCHPVIVQVSWIASPQQPYSLRSGSKQFQTTKYSK